MIDRKTDEVYIADTPRFVLYKLNRNGKLLAENTQQLKFPNQVVLKDNHLYVANTNYHQVKIVSANTKTFGEQISSHRTILEGEHRWPAQLVSTGDLWWVVITDNAMSHGRINVYDNGWQKKFSPELPQNADPMGIVLFNDEVWLADWTKFQIYRFNPDGSPLANFSNLEFDNAFSRWRQDTHYYQSIANYALATFIILLVLGIIAAFRLEKRETLNFLSPSPSIPTPTTEDQEIELPPGEGEYWIPNRFLKYDFLVTKLFSGLILITVGLIIYILATHPQTSWPILFLLCSVLIPYFLLIWYWKKLTAVKLGVSGNYLLIEDAQGNEYTSMEHPIQYSNQMLVLGDGIALLGNKKFRLFPKEELERWVMPRLHTGQYINDWQATMILIKQRHPAILMSLGMIVYFMILLLLFMLYINKGGYCSLLPWS